MSILHRQEMRSDNEDQYIKQISLEIQKRQHQQAMNNECLRGFNAKTHAGLKAAFTVDDKIPKDIKIGLFKVGGQFDAYVRFANGDLQCGPDKALMTKPSCISILILGEQKQAFTLLTTKSFFASDLKGFIKVNKYLACGKAAAFFWYYLNPFQPRWFNRVRCLWNIIKLKSQTVNLATSRFWSTTAYALGDQQACQFLLKPTTTMANFPMSVKGDMYFRDNIYQTLKKSDITYDFYIQLQSNSKDMPVENPIVEWCEKQSKPIKVGTVTIPKQALSNDLINRVDKMCFSPWICYPEHQPLGCINRARKLAYQESFKYRSETEIT